MKKLCLSLAGLAALAACGGGSSSTLSPATVAAYQRSTLSASTAVTTYQSATQTMTTPSQCQAAVQQYASAMTAAIQQMQQHAQEMDDHMRSMGQPGAADVTCGADVMEAQLQDHLAHACGSGDLNQDRTLAQQHSQTMAQDADHLQMRAAGMAAMAGGDGATAGAGMMGDGGMMGTDAMNATMSTMMANGFTAPDGEHMGWNDAMPGCAYHDGQYTPTAPTPPPSTTPAATPAG